MSDAGRQILEVVSNLLERSDLTADDFYRGAYALLLTALAKSPRREASLASIERGALREDVEGYIARLAAYHAARAKLH